MKIHHIGYLVHSIEKAQIQFEELGFTNTTNQIHDKFRGINILFMTKDGYTIELISPAIENSVVSNLIKQYKNSPYHICYQSFNIAEDMQALKKNKYIKITEFEPAIALENKKVVFFVHPHLGMIEVIDANA
ncbi:VOC family protein [Nitratidesulfovibrio vulgaris]|uniref:Methylmalonyl-CoA epimerase n=1 Tax=Nitratidesulfovibrio vulgaris (strain DP4) TaxID=391774 RepID=A0A0H3AAH2_NITV4|nr:VOC family protein [Nitratidesulfovibrio vulgaris]ABM29608.1 methylmalonyl-CoA epimerase [Nitratidesulfovibrio vulgaris DP4]